MPMVVPPRALVVGFGQTNQAVARALLARGHEVVAVDDRSDDDLAQVAAEIGVRLVAAPGSAELAELVSWSEVVLPAPGLPDAHPVFAAAARADVPLASEFDLAAAWDDRPCVAITGTNGKTTVTTMVTEMLRAGGIACVDAGNNDLPLVAAIDDPAPEWFVVEASSFRLGRTRGWAPRVATWLNLAPDHLDVHVDHDHYTAAKARMWAGQRPHDVAVGNLDDPVVAAHLASAPGRHVSFSLVHDGADYHLGPGSLVGPGGAIVAVDELPRALVHDLANALAAAATAEAAGCPRSAVVEVLRRFSPLPHRVCPVATIDSVTYYDDSKATVPHATLAALSSFDSVVLIAGGRNKGLDLSVLADGADHIRAVVAIGEAAPEVAAAFAGLRPTEIADSMARAVALASTLARPGDAVLLSPACASFDWYDGYGARGDDFAAEVLALEAGR